MKVLIHLVRFLSSVLGLPAAFFPPDCCLSLALLFSSGWSSETNKQTKKNSVALSPQANYTD
jgi:hypothetical protein